MPLVIRVNTAAFGPEDVFTAKGKLTRKFARCAKEAYAEMGSLWHDKILPLHFYSRAKHRYSYAPRSMKYRMRRNVKGIEADVDLVFSGAMRTQMQQFATIRAFPTRATVNVQAPPYMTLRPNTTNFGSAKRERLGGSTQPDKFKELSALTTADYNQLQTRLQTVIERAMKR